MVELNNCFHTWPGCNCVTVEDHERDYKVSILTASGGFGAPISYPMYDLLPTFTAQRGGIKFEDLTQPMSKKDTRFLQMACGVATQSTLKFRHGCVVVKHGKILGASPNLYKADPAFSDWRHSQVHAEMAAMRKAGFPMKATVYVSRINGKGESRLSKPCANCAEVLDAHKAKVIWTHG